MADIEKLQTNYVNDILDTSANTEKVFDIVKNGSVIENKISLQDITRYLRQGSTFGAEDINKTNTIVNAINDKLADGGITVIPVAEWETMSEADKMAKIYCVNDNGKGKLYVNGIETSGASMTVVDEATWATMTAEEKSKGVFLVKRDKGYRLDANNIHYDNSTSLASAQDVQLALDQLYSSDASMQGQIGTMNTSISNLNTSVDTLNTGLAGVKGVTDKMAFYGSAESIAFGLQEATDIISYIDLVDTEHRHRMVFAQNNLLYQLFNKDGTHIRNVFDILTHPIVTPISFLMGSTVEQVNCNIIKMANIGVVNISGYSCTSGGAIMKLPFVASARINVFGFNAGAEKAIVYVDANSDTVNITSGIQNMYCYLVIPYL